MNSAQSKYKHPATVGPPKQPSRAVTINGVVLAGGASMGSGAGRLKSENESTGFGAAYSYDRFGNRSTMTVTGDDNYTVAYSYDANNRLTQDVKTAGVAVTTSKYLYDPNGNQLSKVSETLTPSGAATPQVGIGPSGVEIYDYDGFNRMARSNVNGVEATYTYRADGLRNSKETADGKTTHLWDGTNIVADLNGTAVVDRYVRGVGLVLADDGTGQKYYLYDGHGDVVQLAGSSGAIVWKYDYDAFGNEREIAGQDAMLDNNPFRYCGEYFDKETGSIYLRARYYSPVLGRFLTEDTYRGDPKNPLSLGLYVYCGNNSIMFTDPSGHQRAAGYYTISGVYGWYSDPDASEFGKNSSTYQTIDYLSNLWFATTNQAERDKLHDAANIARATARQEMLENNIQVINDVAYRHTIQTQVEVTIIQYYIPNLILNSIPIADTLAPIGPDGRSVDASIPGKPVDYGIRETHTDYSYIWIPADYILVEIRGPVYTSNREQPSTWLTFWYEYETTTFIYGPNPSFPNKNN